MNMSEDDLGILFICAVRYCLGRKTYMPSMIQGIVLGNIKQVSKQDLIIIRNDVQDAARDNYLGSEYIDAPGWKLFMDKISEEIESRSANDYND